MPDEAPITIRPAQLDDLQQLIDFIRPFVDSNRLLHRTAEELEELIQTGFVAEQSGNIVGCSALEVYSNKLAEIRSLAVAPECRGTGLGKQLVAACVQLATDRGVFEVMAITSSESFFHSCGFEFTLPGEKKALFIQTRDDH